MPAAECASTGDTLRRREAMPVGAGAEATEHDGDVSEATVDDMEMSASNSVGNGEAANGPRNQQLTHQDTDITRQGVQMTDKSQLLDTYWETLCQDQALGSCEVWA